MDNTIIWLIVLSILSILIGLMLLYKDVPYSLLLSTLHKIISFALGLVYLLVMYIHINAWGIAFYPSIIAIATIIIFIISVISGSILINGDTENREMKITHRITSILAYILGIYSLTRINII